MTDYCETPQSARKRIEPLKILGIMLIGCVSAVVIIGAVITCTMIFMPSPDLEKMEAELLARELPPQTEIIDTQSASGGFTGVGDNTQYLATALIKTGLTEEQLRDFYYSKYIKMGIDPGAPIMRITSLDSLKKKYGVGSYIVLVDAPENGGIPEYGSAITYKIPNDNSENDCYYIIYIYDSWSWD